MSNYLCGRLCGAIVGLVAFSGCVTVPQRIGYHEDMQLDVPECRGDNNCAVLLSENIKAVNPKLLLKVLGEIDAVVLHESSLYLYAVRREHAHILAPSEGGETLSIHLKEITDGTTFVSIFTRLNEQGEGVDRWSKVVADRLAEEARDRR
ncbi:MAG TPA: hypothetical protein PKH07_07050 [bacterium]|nr:hypothetical protein [bacterium]